MNVDSTFVNLAGKTGTSKPENENNSSRKINDNNSLLVADDNDEYLDEEDYYQEVDNTTGCNVTNVGGSASAGFQFALGKKPKSKIESIFYNKAKKLMMKAAAAQRENAGMDVAARNGKEVNGSKDASGMDHESMTGGKPNDLAVIYPMKKFKAYHHYCNNKRKQEEEQEKQQIKDGQSSQATNKDGFVCFFL
jgi:hypothetical protein